MKTLNPMECYLEIKGKDINHEFDIIIKHDLFTNSEKSQRMYELFCEVHSCWLDYMGLKNCNLL